MKLAGRYLLWCVVCLCLLSCSTQKEEEEIRFAIVSDLHAPDLPDGKERMQAVVEAANKEDVDFLIQLGDFIRLDSVSMPLREVWNGFKGETFHVFLICRDDIIPLIKEISISLYWMGITCLTEKNISLIIKRIIMWI